MSSGRETHAYASELVGSCATDDARPQAALDDAERELAVMTAVLQTLTAWECLAQGSELLLRERVGALGQMAGALWLPKGDLLITRTTWSMPSVDRQALERSLGRRRVPSGLGLAGCAWELGEVLDRPTPGRGERLSGCDEASQGLKPTIAIPCSNGGEVLAVVELYSTAMAQLSSHLLRVLGYAGRGFGVFFARRRGELSLTPLSLREVEVLTLAAQGLSVRGIAAELTISPATVKTHLEHIYRKIGVRDRTAAVAQALRAGLIE
jgi:DNA-binding CsgD family transcriptional regulator